MFDCNYVTMFGDNISLYCFSCVTGELSWAEGPLPYLMGPCAEAEVAQLLCPFLILINVLIFELFI